MPLPRMAGLVMAKRCLRRLSPVAGNTLSTKNHNRNDRAGKQQQAYGGMSLAKRLRDIFGLELLKRFGRRLLLPIAGSQTP